MSMHTIRVCGMSWGSDVRRHACRLAIECSENSDMVVDQEDVPRLMTESIAIDHERAFSTICGMMAGGIGYAENPFPRS